MNHNPMDDAMFWVGALFVLTPIVLTAIVVGSIWLQRRHRRRSGPDPVLEPPAS